MLLKKDNNILFIFSLFDSCSSFNENQYLVLSYLILVVLFFVVYFKKNNNIDS